MRLLQALLAVSALVLAAHAHPVSTSFVSVPLQPVPKRGSSLLPSTVVHQQHLNRALRRLDHFTRSTSPTTDDQLLHNLARRAAALPPHLHERYYLPSLDYLSRLAAQNANQSGSNASQNFAVNGKDTEAGEATHSDGVTPAKKPTFKNTLGLDIQAQDIGYLSQVQIGTPKRDFRLLMDSGSADLWIGAEDCQPSNLDAEQENCGPHLLLGPNSSSTFHDTQTSWQIEYGTGSVSGTIVTDTISIAGLKLTNHTFGVAHHESDEFIPDYIPFDGLLGLAKRMISRQKVPTLLDALVSTGDIKHPIISYHIPRLADGKSNNYGELTFGALNPAKYDPKTLVSVTNVSPLGFWEASLQDVIVNGKKLGWTNRTAIFDTGTTLLIGPPADVNALHANIPSAVYHNDTNYWTLPCVTPKGSKPPTMALKIGGRTFPIDSRDLLFMPIDDAHPDGDCLSGISAGMPGGPNEWLVGDVFLKNVYMSTNEETNKISFANLKK
ncbi:hypothetical protein H2248_008363 [Termitomyces sp. 'cryptogamus']|nr:hypothetical protein H2248_008363 [Termitomyces sp. 'cryptogamus']